MYADSIYEYEMNQGDMLSIPYFFYDFEYAEEAAVNTNIEGVVLDTLFGTPLFGSMMSDNIQKNAVDDDLEMIQALCTFNAEMEEYIHNHAEAVNEGLINKDIVSFSKNMASSSGNTEEDMKNAVYIEALLGEELAEGHIRLKEAQKIEKLIPAYLASELIASGYGAVIEDTTGYGTWKNFGTGCFELLSKYYSYDELENLIVNTYFEDRIQTNRIYYNLLNASCSFPIGVRDFKCKTNSVFVQGEGKRTIKCYCKENEEGERQIFCIKIVDNDGKVRVVLCYDYKGNITMVSDEMNNREYHYYNGMPLGGAAELSYDEVLKFASWITELCRNDEKIDKKTYESMRQCFVK